jgi:hypothetical protein
MAAAMHGPRDVDVAAHGAFGQAALRKQWSR